MENCTSQKFSSLTAFINSLRIVIERNSSGKEFHIMAPIKVVRTFDEVKVCSFVTGDYELVGASRTLRIIYPGNIPRRLQL